MLAEIKNLNLAQLEEVLIRWQVPAFRARQIFSWLYQKRVKSFEQMANLPADLRKKLKENFSFSSLSIIRALKSRDGTEKFLFALGDKNLIEAVIIPAKGRITGCISTQAGCRFACRFCASGMRGFKRNLTTAEIINEVLALKEHAPRLTHLVFMGIGEPLDNYTHVLEAIRMVNSGLGLNIGARRITISTSGLVPGIRRLAQEGLQIELSVSLHAADEKTRSLLMPVNRKYPLRELISACKEYIQKTNRQVTFEYILIKGINSHLQSARNLGRILRGLNCKVNLIPANPLKELKVEPPENSAVILFRDTLREAGVQVTLRKPRGQDIEAACGQLRLNYEKT